MAKVQRFYEDNKPEHFSEGPWLLIQHPIDQLLYRIERFNSKECCTTTVIGTAHYLMAEAVIEGMGSYPGCLNTWDTREYLAPIVDELNYVERTAR